MESRGLRGPWTEALALLYCGLVALFWLTDPLALAPQLDSRENLQLAAQLSLGTLSAEPFYRAMLYPFLISRAPVPAFWPYLVVVFGLALHVTAAFQVRSLAGKLWEGLGARRLAFLFYLLNPASLFYALQAMDMALAIVLFLGALQCVYGKRAPTRRLLLTGGLLAGAACLARPHFLPVALVLVAAQAWHAGSKGFRRLIAPATVMTGLALVLLIQGGINYHRSGEFRILPWQGTYNLYAANREGANGLYYKQTLDVSGETFLNPARAESEEIYKNETGKGPPLEISAMNRFWRSKTVEAVLAHPLRWLRLVAFKAYAVANSHEQYNNLTFSYHKARIGPLHYNPLNWGILLIIASMGAVALLARERKSGLVVISLILGYAVSLILYYASARFRLPLVAGLAVLGGGLPEAYGLARRSGKNLACMGGLLVAVAGLTFSGFAGVRNLDTYVQDRLLLANAHADLGQDAEAARLAREVLREFPSRREAQRIYTVSYFNLRLIQSPEAEEFGTWEDQKTWVIQEPPTDPIQDVILGVYAQIWGNPQQARYIWAHFAGSQGPAQALASACIAAAENHPAANGTEVPPLQAALAALFHSPTNRADAP